MTTFRIRSRDQDVIGTEDIPLESRSNESLDMITRRDEDLPTSRGKK